MKNAKSNYSINIKGFIIGILLLILTLFLTSILVTCDVLAFDKTIWLIYLSLAIISFLTFLFLKKNSRLIFWAIFNIIVWCTVLWTIGLILFRQPIKMDNAIFEIISILIGSASGVAARFFIGGK